MLHWLLLWIGTILSLQQSLPCPKSLCEEGQSLYAFEVWPFALSDTAEEQAKSRALFVLSKAIKPEIWGGRPHRAGNGFVVLEARKECFWGCILCWWENSFNVGFVWRDKWEQGRHLMYCLIIISTAEAIKIICTLGNAVELAWWPPKENGREEKDNLFATDVGERQFGVHFRLPDAGVEWVEVGERMSVVSSKLRKGWFENILVQLDCQEVLRPKRE